MANREKMRQNMIDRIRAGGKTFPVGRYRRNQKRNKVNPPKGEYSFEQ